MPSLCVPYIQDCRVWTNHVRRGCVCAVGLFMIVQAPRKMLSNKQSNFCVQYAGPWRRGTWIQTAIRRECCLCTVNIPCMNVLLGNSKYEQITLY